MTPSPDDLTEPTLNPRLGELRRDPEALTEVSLLINARLLVDQDAHLADLAVPFVAAVAGQGDLRAGLPGAPGWHTTDAGSFEAELGHLRAATRGERIDTPMTWLADEEAGAFAGGWVSTGRLALTALLAARGLWAVTSGAGTKPGAQIAAPIFPEVPDGVTQLDWHTASLAGALGLAVALSPVSRQDPQWLMALLTSNGHHTPNDKALVQVFSALKHLGESPALLQAALSERLGEWTWIKALYPAWTRHARTRGAPLRLADWLPASWQCARGAPSSPELIARLAELWNEESHAETWQLLAEARDLGPAIARLEVSRATVGDFLRELPQVRGMAPHAAGQASPSGEPEGSATNQHSFEMGRVCHSLTLEAAAYSRPGGGELVARVVSALPYSAAAIALQASKELAHPAQAEVEELRILDKAARRLGRRGERPGHHAQVAPSGDREQQSNPENLGDSVGVLGPDELGTAVGRLLRFMLEIEQTVGVAPINAPLAQLVMSTGVQAVFVPPSLTLARLEAARCRLLAPWISGEAGNPRANGLVLDERLIHHAASASIGGDHWHSAAWIYSLWRSMKRQYEHQQEIA